MEVFGFYAINHQNNRDFKYGSSPKLQKMITLLVAGYSEVCSFIRIERVGGTTTQKDKFSHISASTG